MPPCKHNCAAQCVSRTENSLRSSRGVWTEMKRVMGEAFEEYRSPCYRCITVHVTNQRLNLTCTVLFIFTVQGGTLTQSINSKGGPTFQLPFLDKSFISSGLGLFRSRCELSLIFSQMLFHIWHICKSVVCKCSPLHPLPASSCYWSQACLATRLRMTRPNSHLHTKWGTRLEKHRA